MDCANIIESVRGNVKVLQYNKPTKKNAIDVHMYIGLTKLLRQTALDDNITLTVLTGTGDFYSSGNDLLSALNSFGEYDMLEILKSFVEAFIKFPKTLIAIVNGPAIGVAATTLAFCDLVFASETAYFYTPFTKLGLCAEACSSVTFPRIIGERRAADMLLFNHKMSAAEALEWGFVNYLYKPEELQTKVWDKIMEVSKLPKTSLLTTKKLIRSPIVDDLMKAHENEMKELEKIWGTEDHTNRLLEFVTKKSNRSKL